MKESQTQLLTDTWVDASREDYIQAIAIPTIAILEDESWSSRQMDWAWVGAWLFQQMQALQCDRSFDFVPDWNAIAPPTAYRRSQAFKSQWLSI